MSSSNKTTHRRSMVPRSLVTRLRHRSFNAEASPAQKSPEIQEVTLSLPDEEFYPTPVQQIQEKEYGHMNEGTYLDHSGTTIYAQSLVDAFARRMTTGLYGNPHSANEPAARSGRAIDGVREQTLRFLGADPRHFDLVFVANATAGIKLVADAFRDLAERGTRGGHFWYGFHKDSHTSLVGVRELAGQGSDGSHCFVSDDEVEQWLRDPDSVAPQGGGGPDPPAAGDISLAPPPRRRGLALLAWPGQSNMSGRRLPLSWSGRVRSSPALRHNTYTLLDCAALAMTSPLHEVFGDPSAAPDFACISFYKIFGFPDLGALVVRKESGHILTLRRYFGGGTVAMVSVLGAPWHKVKGRDAGTFQAAGGDGRGAYDIHDGLEDGTLPFHSIIALGEAIDVHERLYGSMDNVSRHTTNLSLRLYQKLRCLAHANGRPLCHIYTEDGGRGFGDSRKQGATIAFNLLDPSGYYIPYSDVERIANASRIYIRSGGICCPGGIFTALDYEPWELQRALSANHACGPDGIGLIQQVPTGVVRASLGAMSTKCDVDNFVMFLQRTFLDREMGSAAAVTMPPTVEQKIYVADKGEDLERSNSTLISVAPT